MSTKFDLTESSKQFTEILKKEFDKFLTNIPNNELYLQEKAGEAHITLSEIKEIIGENESIQINELIKSIKHIRDIHTTSIIIETMEKISPILKDRLNDFKDVIIQFEKELQQNTQKPHPEEITINEDTKDTTTDKKPEMITESNKISDEKLEHIKVCMENDMTDEEIEKTTKVSKEIIAHLRNNPQ